MKNWQSWSSWLIGLGMIFFVWHNPYQPLINYVFLPHIGMMMIITGISLTFLKADTKKLFDFGDKKLWIPLAIIAISISLSGINTDFPSKWQGMDNRLVSFGMSTAIAIMLFGIFVACRQLGNKVFKPFAIAVIIEVISIIWYGTTHNWIPNGGLLSPTNYDIATGFIVFGVLVSPSKHQWWLASIALMGLYFSGSAEGIFVSFVMVIAVGIRYWQKHKFWTPIYVTCFVILITIPIGIFDKVQAPQLQRAALLFNQTEYIAEHNQYISKEGNNIDKAFGYRLTHFQLSPIRPLGYGINLNNFYWGIPHNIFLIIIEQVGIIALLAWLLVAYQGLRKKTYIWLGFVALGIFDHFTWTQAAPWFWSLAGISSLSLKER